MNSGGALKTAPFLIILATANPKKCSDSGSRDAGQIQPVPSRPERLSKNLIPEDPYSLPRVSGYGGPMLG